MHKPTAFPYGKVAARVVIATVAVLALGGPSPGHIGSCDGSAERTSYADFCRLYQQARCLRDYNNGMPYGPDSPARLDGAGYSACANEIEMRCTGGSYGMCNGVETSPVRTQTDACIGAMSDPTRNAIPESMLIECVFSSCGGI